MTFLNVFIAVILCLAALVGIVLILPLSLRVMYRGTTTVFAYIGPVRFKVYPSEDKSETQKRKQKGKKHQKTSVKDDRENVQQKTKEQTPNRTESQSESKCENKAENVSRRAQSSASHKSVDKSDIGEILGFVKDIVEKIAELFSKHAKIRIDALKVVVSKDDAADTAIQFGLCSGIVSSILAFTSYFGKAVIKDKNVRVEPDFISGKNSVETDITLSVRTCFVLSTLIKIFFEDLTEKNKSTIKGKKK